MSIPSEFNAKLNALLLDTTTLSADMLEYYSSKLGFSAAAVNSKNASPNDMEFRKACTVTGYLSLAAESFRLAIHHIKEN